MAKTSTTTDLPALLYPRDLLAPLLGQPFDQRIRRSLAPLQQLAMLSETPTVVWKAYDLVMLPNVPCRTKFGIEPIILGVYCEVQPETSKHCLNMALER